MGHFVRVKEFRVKQFVKQIVRDFVFVLFYCFSFVIGGHIVIVCFYFVALLVRVLVAVLSHFVVQNVFVLIHVLPIVMDQLTIVIVTVTQTHHHIEHPISIYLQYRFQYC